MALALVEAVDGEAGAQDHADGIAPSRNARIAGSEEMLSASRIHLSFDTAERPVRHGGGVPRFNRTEALVVAASTAALSFQ